MGVKPGNTRLSVPVGSLLLLLLSLLLAPSLLAQQGTVRSELSASTITRDESVILTVTAVGVEGEPDTSALEKDFDIVGRSSSRQFTSVADGNNQPTVLSIVKWTLELLPRDVGVFTIPAVTVGGVSSQLLSLTVNEIPAGARRDVFVEASVDSRTPWVQSQVLMTVRVFQAIEIVEGGLSDPSGSDLQVQRIGKDSQSMEVRDGREFRVTERRFALFPQKSGTVTIDPIVLSVAVPTQANASLGFFSPTRKLTRRSDPITLEVKARPDSGAAWWLPASAVQIDSNWADDVGKAVVDQPLTRTIVLRAGGVLDSQLPDIEIPAIEGVSLYAEEPVRAMGMNERGLVAEQTVKWALIPQREGELVLPPLSIEWFNTDTGKTEHAVLPEERIQVARSATTANASQVTPPGSTADSADRTGAEAGLPGAGNTVEPLASLDESGTMEERGREDSTALDSGPSGNGSTALAVTDDGLVAADSNSKAGSAEALAANAGGAVAAASDRIVGGLSAASWRLATMALLVLWAGSFMVFWWWRRRLLQARGDESAQAGQTGRRGQSTLGQRARRGYQKLAPLAAVDACCKGGDPAALRSALIDWAARQWPQQPPSTLTDIALRLDEGAARRSLEALDAALYSRTSPSDQQGLMARMRSLPGELSAALANKETEGAADGRLDTASGKPRSGRGLPAL